MLLGVDAGGTSTRAVLLDRSGRCLGYGTAGGGNPVSWGVEAAAAEIVAAARSAFAQSLGGDEPSGAGPESVTGTAVLAMAGGSAVTGTRAIEAALGAAGLDVTVAVASDLLATFCSGTAALGGYALVSGTGAAAVRVRDGAVDSSVDGLGWLLGDAGSGFWIGHRVVRAALAAVDGRGPATALTAMVMRDLGIVVDGSLVGGRPAELQAAVDVLYRRRPVELSRFAELAFRAAGETAGIPRDDVPAEAEAPGDPVAIGILRGARQRLVASLVAVRASGVVGPVVLGGGIARRLPGLPAAISEAFGATDVVTVTDGAVGAGVLALRTGGVAVNEAVFTTLTESVARRR